MMLQQQRTQEALRAMPSAGWIGRRDRAVHVLSQMAGMSDEHIATLTRATVTCETRCTRQARWTLRHRNFECRTVKRPSAKDTAAVSSGIASPDAATRWA